LEQKRIHDMRRKYHQKRISIRGGAGHELRADDTARPRTIVDDDLLAKALAEFVRDDAAEHIRDAARARRYDHSNRLRRKIIGGVSPQNGESYRAAGGGF